MKLPTMVCLSLSVVVGCTAPRKAVVAEIDSSLTPLRIAFNAEADRARVIALFSPR